jgi:NAD/NADP transhydrogenase beta subunit
MCQAMGRNVVSVILGGAGTSTAAPKGEAQIIEGEVTTAAVDDVAEALLAAKHVIICPGYGLAVAQAQVSRVSLSWALFRKSTSNLFVTRSVRHR